MLPVARPGYVIFLSFGPHDPQYCMPFRTVSGLSQKRSTRVHVSFFGIAPFVLWYFVFVQG